MKTRVIGCPKTIDGDLKCKEVPISFGFDTACKVLYHCALLHYSANLKSILNLGCHGHGTHARLGKSVLSAEGIIITFQSEISEIQS
jgi:hypothetical protein